MPLLLRRLVHAFVTLLFALPAVAAPTPLTATAVEYYYAAWDYYFVTSFPDEIAVLDGGAFGGVWKRTGQTFQVWNQAGDNLLPTCRFFSTAFAPKSSHFYTPFATECDGVKANAAWQYESIAFQLQLPDAAGTCPSGTAVLYRLYNNGAGGAPNHRYTASAAVFADMQAKGWTFEGDGRTGAFACVPAPAPSAEGLWRGTTASGRNIVVVVLEDGTYYLLYGGTSSPLITGAIEGASASNAGTFTTQGSRNIGFTGNLASGSSQVSGTYVPRSSLQLTIGAGGSAETVSATYDASYDVAASVATLAGHYSGRNGHVADPFNMSLTIFADGGFTMSGSCSFAGTIVPHAATGVFDFTVHAKSGVCLGGPSNIVHGILVYDAATGVLDAVAPLFEDDMFFMVGTRQ